MADELRSDREQLEVMPLYDLVKLDIYKAYLKLVEVRRSILIDRAEGFTPKERDTFKGELLAFYGFTITKIKYPKDKKYDMLDKLKGFVSHPKDITDMEAEEFFILFAELLEVTGITRIGRASMSDPTNAPFEKTESY